MILNSYNKTYKHKKGLLIRTLWYFTNNFFFHNNFPWPNQLKCFILKKFGATIGEKVLFKPNVNIKYPWLLSVGNYSWIGENVWIDNLSRVIIKDNVCISQGAMLLCGNHNYKKKSFDLILGRITLEEGSWVGAQCIVCPGVTFNSHAILSAGSVANKDLEAYGIYQGNPATKIRTRKIEN